MLVDIGITITSRLRHAITRTRLFLQQLAVANSKGNSKAPHNCPFVRRIHLWSVDSHNNGPVIQETFSSLDITIGTRMSFFYLQYLSSPAHQEPQEDTDYLECVCTHVLFLYAAHGWPSGHLGELTRWGWVTHICVSKLTNIGSDNGLAPGRRQAIIWTNAGILLIRTLNKIQCNLLK